MYVGIGILEDVPLVHYIYIRGVPMFIPRDRTVCRYMGTGTLTLFDRARKRNPPDQLSISAVLRCLSC